MDPDLRDRLPDLTRRAAISTTETTVTAPADEAGPQADEHVGHHPGDLLYVQIALILAVLTAVEVLTYFVDFGPLQTPVLLGLMVVKFAMVAMFFMHLRFDNELFSWVFVSGIVLAALVYVAMLAMFEFF